MHIPDGYLSPTTCAALYCGSAPFWWISLRKLKRAVHTQVIPLVSVFAAFSFIIMMFNLPLPGGTTGHAAGIAIAAITLGPWASILAISIAIGIQAVFFGDGGVTAIGANCFNMAVLGSLAAYVSYRLIAGRSVIDSHRRVLAAGIAGYIAINLAALAAATELGIQPLFFRDSSGAALYAPYPLHISIPAMMLGHLTVSGIAELLLSAGVIAYLQRSEPALLRMTVIRPRSSARSRISLKPIWIGLGIAAMLTPLGILASGSAWAEWSIQDWLRPGTREQIARVSAGQMPPALPAGLEHVAAIWSAPFAGYAPQFLQNASLGYAVSAVLGVGFIVAACFSFGLIWTRGRNTFLERTLRNLLRTSEYSVYAEETAGRQGVFQKIDPRMKIAGVVLIIVATAFASNLRIIAGVFLFGTVFALFSKISVAKLAGYVWIPALIFSGIVATPAIFLAHGSSAGIRSAAFLISRTETIATLSALLALTTPWPWILKGLRSLKCPAIFVTILGMTYRYVHDILRTALETLESRRSRTVGTVDSLRGRLMTVSAISILMSKSFELSRDVHLAMQSRGFRGKTRVLADFRTKKRDWYWLLGLALLSAAVLWWGRS